MIYDELVAAVTAARAALLDSIEACPPSMRLTSPGPDRWHVVSVLDHIDHTQTRIVGLLELLIARSQKRGTLEQADMERVSVNVNYREALPSYGVIPAFPGTEPTGRLEEEIIASLAASAPRLQSVIEMGRGHDCTALVAPHPIGRLNFYEWIYLVAEHDRIHTEQVNEIVRDLE